MNEILQEAMGEHVLLHSKPKLTDADKLERVRKWHIDEWTYLRRERDFYENIHATVPSALCGQIMISLDLLLAIIDEEG